MELLQRLFLMVLVMDVTKGSLRQPCGTYGCPHQPHYEPFIPAPPGHTPRCAKPGQTFCETPDYYPQKLIKFLVEKCSYDYSTILRDESDYNFNVYTSQPETNSGYSYSKPKVPQFYQQSLALLQQQYHQITGQSSVIYTPSSSGNESSPEGYIYSPPNVSFGSPFLQIVPQKYLPVADAINQNPALWINSQVHRAESLDKSSRTERENPLLNYANIKLKKRQSTPDVISVCPTKSRFLVPKAALNNRGNWMYVVNVGETSDNYSQLIKSEICESTTCSGLCELPSGYTSRCEQQYVQKRLVALEGSGNNLYTDVFWFPHGCSCQIQPAF